MTRFHAALLAGLVSLPCLRADEPKAGAEKEIAGIKLCWCPPGKFMMGSPEKEPDHRADEAQVEVTLTKGFWTAKYEPSWPNSGRISRK